MSKNRKSVHESSTSEDESNIQVCNKKPNRKIRKPKRFGITDNNSNIVSYGVSDDMSEPFEDDSLDEYHPSPKRRKTDTGNLGKSSTLILNHSDEIVEKDHVDFNDEFDVLSSIYPEKTSKAIDMNIAILRKESTSQSLSTSGQLIQSKESDAFKMHEKWYEKICGMLNEVVSRITVLENRTINDQLNGCSEKKT